MSGNVGAQSSDHGEDPRGDMGQGEAAPYGVGVVHGGQRPAPHAGGQGTDGPVKCNSEN